MFTSFNQIKNCSGACLLILLINLRNFQKIIPATMELDTTVQTSINELHAQTFDLLIAASGYETRSVFLSQKILSSKVKRKVVLAFQERRGEISRPDNDIIFKQLGFEFVDASVSSDIEIKRVLNNFCATHNSGEANVLIDYSSMPKFWYEAVIQYFIENEPFTKKINVWFSYTPSEYAESKHVRNRYFLDKLPGDLSAKPKALIIGLGYEKGRAEELASRLKSDATYSFYSDPAVDPRFVEELIENNKEILTRLDDGKIITYPIQDLNYINSSLTHLCVDLRLKYQIVLASIGPKPFTLMCFLLNARYPDIKVWRFSSEAPKEVYDRKPHGELLVYKVHFTSESVDYDD